MTIRAAGGVVWRRVDGAVEVAVVHRPRYDDWSLPKGKQLDRESLLETAVREVGEELGASVAVQRRLGQFGYDVEGVPKEVTYWGMGLRSGDFRPNDEVDEVRWLAVADANALLSYDIDRKVLAEFSSVPVPDAVIVLVRHAKAGKRTEWTGDDALRPLDDNGSAQADRLATLLACFAPQEVYTADRVRCVATVEPLAKALDLDLRVDPVFNDEAYLESPKTTEAALLALGRPGMTSVVCSQGDAIPALVDRVRPDVRSVETRKGAWWVWTVVAGEVTSADHYDAP